MRVLDRKLWRDLWHLRGMAAAISLVLLGGIATFVMSRVTYESLSVTQQRYYVDQRFAEVFAGLVRAPESVAQRLAAVPGVNQLETRVVAAVNLEIEGYGDPVTGKIVSLPEHGEPLLNVPWLRRGRLPHPARRRRGHGQRRLRRGAWAGAGRPDHRHHQGTAQAARHRRHHAVARIHVRHPAGRDLPGL
jgi:hypothetical protein